MKDEVLLHLHNEMPPSSTFYYPQPLLSIILFLPFAEDRVPPRIITNSALTLDEGTAKIITTDLLSATDTDSQPGDLQYFINTPPELGHIERAGSPGAPITQFTQGDIAARAISYVHTSEGEGNMDRFTFSVNDGTNQVRDLKQ